ncbi:prepilin peptidase [Spirillospora sp. CA-253888]
MTPDHLPLALAAGLLGLPAGSFLNVVAHRVPRGESLLFPASRCPHCGAGVRARHNVPVLGWLLLRGRCADCRAPIGAHYPLVELATAVLFAAVALRLGPTAALPAYLYLAAVAVPLTVIDLRVRRLPNTIVLPSYPVCGALLLAASAAGGDPRAMLRALAAMAAVGACYLLLYRLYPGGMGAGDVKLSGLLGLCLGWLGWSQVAVGILGGFLLGGVIGVLLLASGRAGRRSAMPFGPSMLAGALLAVLAAGPVADWYRSLFPSLT